ncbi:MAG: hypothetical protein GTO18_13770 [Anaerolineales bacterium]|nr:hypothetical protein [Anaerolineales bacterium]
MASRLSNWLIRVSSGRVTLIALVIFLLFTSLVLPGQSSRSASGTGDAGSPDLTLFYSAEDLYRWAEAYGEEGRTGYVRARFTFDLVWPLVYTFFLVTSISWLFSRYFPKGSPWLQSNLAPVLGMIFDYMENIFTSIVMLRFPDQTPIVASIAGIFTGLKWTFVGLSFVLLVVGIVVYVWGRIRGKASRG